MAKFGYSIRYESLAKELIHHSLNFDEVDENFTASMNYVMSNLLYHHCLDVNSHNVQRSLQGITFKMGIHGHQKKADRLHTLTENFISSPELQDQGDLKWAILSVLIDLSHQPARDSLSSSLISEANSVSDGEVKDSLDSDWIRELKEKSFHLPDRDETLSEWSDDDEMRRSFPQRVDSDAQIRGRSNSQEYKCTMLVEGRERLNFFIKESHLAKSWITNTIQKPYWDPERGKLIVNPNEDANKECKNVLTEYSVMRECIWVLLLPDNGFIFRKERNQFKTFPVATKSLSRLPLQKLLLPVAQAASKLLSLDSWLKSPPALGVGEEREHLGTLQSYADGLRRWREDFGAKVHLLEKKVCDKEESPTLLWLLKELEAEFSVLSSIYNVHCKAFDCQKEPVLKTSLKLLSLLVQSVESGAKGVDRARLLTLLSFSLRNQLRGLGALMWDRNASNEACMYEFGIVRTKNEDCAKMGKAFSLDEMGYLDLPGLNFLRVLRDPLMKILHLKEMAKDLEISELEPSYLEDLVEAHVWNKFRHPQAQAQPQFDATPECSPTEIGFQDQISPLENGEEISPVKDEDEYETEAVITRNEIETGSILNEDGNKDEMRRVEEGVEMLKLFNEDLFLLKAFEEEEEKVHCQKEDRLECRCLSSSIGLEYLLTTTLLPVLQNRYSELGRASMRALVESRGLRRQLGLFKSIVLLLSTSRMNEFYSYLFHKIDSNEPVEENDLSQNLQFCVGLSCPKLAPRFGVALKGSAGDRPSTASLADVLTSISIDFSDLWPLSIVLSESVRAKYNLLFVFCLMLKRAVFTLERLHFKEIATFDSPCSGDSRSSSSSSFSDDLTAHSSFEAIDNPLALNQRLHRLHLLRQWLLYFSGVFHDHFYTAILIPFSERIEELLGGDHLVHFISEHENLLNKVCNQCLLTEEKRSLIQTILARVFSTVEKVRELWMGTPDKITEHELHSLEEQYSTCHRCMANFLSQLALVRFCPFVEGMAHSLAYNCPT